MSKFTTTTISYHFTKPQAEDALGKLRAQQEAGRSSGWKRIDYSIKRSARKFKRWRIVAVSG